jgi:hypothetical protein
VKAGARRAAPLAVLQLCPSMSRAGSWQMTTRNRHRFWAALPELEGRHLRVVTLSDKTTVHNAFPDRRFKP